MNEHNLEILQKNIDYQFKNIELLKNALTHTSYAYEHNTKSNEKLEFLGDSILEFISSDYIYKNYPKLKEGEMTKVRATVVCESSLYKIAKKHNFGDFLYTGKSEKVSKGNQKPAILADSVEAIIAGIYLDGGLESAKKFIIENLKDEIEIATKHVGIKDYKTVLQEKLQENGNIKIEYKIIKETGPNHDKTFEAEVLVEGKKIATGIGKNKKHAEMEAARKALKQIQSK